MAATLVWECVAEFNIVRTHTMSCVFSYTETAGHTSEGQSGCGGPSVARGTNCGDIKCRRCRTWSGGAIVGGPLVCGVTGHERITFIGVQTLMSYSIHCNCIFLQLQYLRSCSYIRSSVLHEITQIFIPLKQSYSI